MAAVSTAEREINGDIARKKIDVVRSQNRITPAVDNVLSPAPVFLTCSSRTLTTWIRCTSRSLQGPVEILLDLKYASAL